MLSPSSVDVMGMDQGSRSQPYCQHIVVLWEMQLFAQQANLFFSECTHLIRLHWDDGAQGKNERVHIFHIHVIGGNSIGH